MGVELRLQAIPEDCELLARARQECEIAEEMEYFDVRVRGVLPPSQRKDPDALAFVDALRELVKANPGLDERYAYLGNRNFDAILYLLSPVRRAGDYKNDRSLIYKAIKGSEPLHPDARAAQGRPIGFVPAEDVRVIANYLDTVTAEKLHEHYNPAQMEQAAVYKIFSRDDEQTFQYIWDEFTEIRDLYRAAADHGEAVITVID